MIETRSVITDSDGMWCSGITARGIDLNELTMLVSAG